MKPRQIESQILSVYPSSAVHTHKNLKNSQDRAPIFPVKKSGSDAAMQGLVLWVEGEFVNVQPHGEKRFLSGNRQGCSSKLFLTRNGMSDWDLLSNKARPLRNCEIFINVLTPKLGIGVSCV